jgi:NaMN:DMB phosphoribosyltransferase
MSIAAREATTWLISDGLTSMAAIGALRKRLVNPEYPYPSGSSSVKPDGSIQFRGLLRT